MAYRLSPEPTPTRHEKRRHAIGDQRSAISAFSLYIHIPYCVAKCPYCDFNSHAASRWPEREYTDALVAELEHYAAQAPWRGGQVATIFFGGGTPSLFAPESIASILRAVHRLWPTVDGQLSSTRSRFVHELDKRSLLRHPRESGDPSDRRVPVNRMDSRLRWNDGVETSTADCPLPTAHCETTLEANPGTISEEKLAGFRAAGVNRLSFGVQSFQSNHLKTLGRIHSGREAIDAVRAARAVRFDNVNIDLIFAVPGQTLDEWDADLRTAIELGTEHVSAYNLTFEEGTAFHAMRNKGEIVGQPEETELAMFTRTQETLGAAGFVQYEISNYSRSNRACAHNLNYWHGGTYLGVGAGAHSFAWHTGGRRWSNEKSPTGYIARSRRDGHARVTEEALSEHQARGEFVFLGLRCLDGLDLDAFADRFGVELNEVFPHGETFQHQGLLVADDRRLRLSERGLLVADSIFATYL